ncbi:hypothetical protein Tco_1114051 [Tanacetum coccineum]|uniref:Uncharacterized protein n=1 Tax=Tanacetum coccineum TaxID=301880 RepID=A0ABQ5IU00_9ASTR
MTYPPLRLEGLPFELEWDLLPNYTIRSSSSFEWHKIIFGMITSMGIRHAKAYTLRGRSSKKLGQRQICNEDLRPELEYFSEDCDEEREMEPKPEPHREATQTIRPRSPVVRKQRERVMGFEEAPNREGSRRGRNAEVPLTCVIFKLSLRSSVIVNLIIILVVCGLGYVIDMYLASKLQPSGGILQVEFRRISLTGFHGCASHSQTGASQSRQSTV